MVNDGKIVIDIGFRVDVLGFALVALVSIDGTTVDGPTVDSNAAVGMLVVGDDVGTEVIADGLGDEGSSEGERVRYTVRTAVGDFVGTEEENAEGIVVGTTEGINEENFVVAAVGSEESSADGTLVGSADGAFD